MAKLNYGAVVLDMRRKIGGTIYSNGRNGPVARKRAKNHRTQLGPYLAAIANWQRLAKHWTHTLDNTDRANWSTFGQTFPVTDRFGNTQNLNGYQFHQRVNRTLNTLGIPPLKGPPATFSVADPGGITLSSGPGPTLLVRPVNAPAAPDYLCIAAGLPVHQGHSYVRKRRPVLGCFIAGTPLPVDITAAYAARFGSLQAGQKIPVTIYFANSTNGATSQVYSGHITL